MTTDEAIQFFGSKEKLAEALGIVNIVAWGESPPFFQQKKLQRVSEGALMADYKVRYFDKAEALYSFDKDSEEILQGCHADLRRIFSEAIRVCNCTVFCGYRDKDDSSDLCVETESKVHGSLHNIYPSMAVDVMPFPADWENTSRIYYFAGRVTEIARRLKHEKRITHDLRWGGDDEWELEEDITHFELVPLVEKNE